MNNSFIDFAFHTISSIENEDDIDRLLFSDDIDLFKFLEIAPFQNYSLLQFQNLTLVISKALTDAEQILNESFLAQLLKKITKTPFFSGPSGYHDPKAHHHLFLILKQLSTDPVLVKLLKEFIVPSKKNLCDIIRKTVRLSPSENLQDHHVRQAVLSALLSFSNLSHSSYATSFRLLIQTNYPKIFLEDMACLLQHGSLTRVFQKKEVTAPINTISNKNTLFVPVNILSSLPPEEIIPLCPGIRAGALAAGILKPTMNSEEQVIILRDLLQKLIKADKLPQNKENWTAAKIFHALTQDFSLSPKTNSLPTSHVTSGSAGINTQFHKEVAYDLAVDAFLNETNNPLLDAWEFTVASFPGQDKEQLRSHLAISLGILPEIEPFSFKESLSLYVEDTLSMLKKEIEECDVRAEHIRAAVAQMQSSALYLPPEKQQHLFAEYRLRKAEFERALYEGNEARRVAELLIQLSNQLLPFYLEEFPRYFQCFYSNDNLMGYDLPASFADDPPAFVLFYTHGRDNSDLWTPIRSFQEFSQAIVAFLNLTEYDLKQKDFTVDIEKYLSAAISALSQNLAKPAFLEASVRRLAAHYDLPLPSNILENQHLLAITPWSYIRSSSLDYLLESYNLLHEYKSSIIKRPETYEELLIFMIDSMKDCPSNFLKSAGYHPEIATITSGPNFSFLTLPGERSFKDAWDQPHYSPSWVKDFWARPHHSFLQNYLLNFQETTALWNKCSQHLSWLPPLSKSIEQRFPPDNVSIPSFFSIVVQICETFSNRALPIHMRQQLEGLLFSLIPLSDKKILQTNIRHIFDYMGITSIGYELFTNEIENSVKNNDFLAASELRDICKGLAILSAKHPFTSDNYHEDISVAMRKLGLLYPAPILIGSLPRPAQKIGFTINPATALIDLWSFDPYGTEGTPLRYYNETESLLQGKKWKLFFPSLETGSTKEES